ncbi:MAG: hypothetical protein ABIQ57_00335 [Candidatus Kapaibacterium sp.]
MIGNGETGIRGLIGIGTAERAYHPTPTAQMRQEPIIYSPGASLHQSARADHRLRPERGILCVRSALLPERPPENPSDRYFRTGTQQLVNTDLKMLPMSNFSTTNQTIGIWT